MAIRIITNVPAGQVSAIEQIMWDSDAISVTHKPEGDGEYTIIGTFRDIERHDDMIKRITKKTSDEIT